MRLREIQKIKELRNIIQSAAYRVVNTYRRLMIGLLIWRFASLSYADGVIPTSAGDQTSANQDFATTMLTILQKDVLPVIEVAGGIWIIWTSISAMAGGVKEAQERQKFDPLKNAIIKTVLVVVVGGALLWLMDQLRTKTFT
jgi:hypothetical protein